MDSLLRTDVLQHILPAAPYCTQHSAAFLPAFLPSSPLANLKAYGARSSLASDVRTHYVNKPFHIDNLQTLHMERMCRE